MIGNTSLSSLTVNEFFYSCSVLFIISSSTVLLSIDLILRLVLLQNDLVQAFTISEYDLGAEGDLFKAPDPIIEGPFPGTDPMTSAFSMISCGPQELSANQGIELFQGDPILSDVFYECRKDLLAKSGIVDTPVADLMDIKNTPLVPIVEDGSDEKSGVLSFQRSISSSCLSSMEGTKWSAASKPRFLDFCGLDFEAVYGMRRAFSEGDIKVTILVTLHSYLSV